MNIKTTLLHVGPHKTGTTYLQASFSRHRAALRARGIVVPEAWEHAPGNASHFKLVQALTENGNLARAETVLQQAFADGGETLLISAEDLSGLKVDALQRLRGLLGDSAVSVIFYVRRWSDLLPSGWQEVIKHGHTTSFPEFLVLSLRNPETSPFFNLDMKLGPLIEVFGRESIKLVCYNEVLESGIDLFRHFAAQFLGWENADIISGDLMMNISRGALEIDLIRRLNMIEFERTGQRSAALRGRLDAAAGKIETTSILSAMESSRRTIHFTDAFPPLRRLHLELREKYRDNVVRPARPHVFFKLEKRDMPYVADDYLMRRGVVDSIYALYDQITPA